MTLGAARLRWGSSQRTEPTPLKQAQALREVLCSAIDGLKPASGVLRTSSPEALQHSILYEEYVCGHSTASIMVRHSISETTFHRNRRQAISAVARELAKQEDLHRRETERRSSFPASSEGTGGRRR